VGLVTEERDTRAVWAACERSVTGFDARSRDARATLLALADRAPAEHEVDRYGGGVLAARLEERVATLLGKEAAAWLPSGTMAQQIVLRVHADRRSRTSVAFHPFCHLDVHEERAYERLHGLHGVLLGHRSRLIEPADVETCADPLAALLLELPQRDLGGRLPGWDDLVATCEAARARGAAVHLDGARLWQCTPFYGRPLDEIASLFDTVYVSFYKDLGAPGGCAVAGPKDVIDEVRLWLVRHGGRIFSAYPYLLAAERGLDEVLPQMAAYVDRARELAAALARIPGISIDPDPPQAAMFHALARLPHEALETAALDVAEETGVWTGASFTPTTDPDVQRTEVTIGASSLAVSVDEAAGLWAEVVRRAASAAD
jgi:threonine aldolase